MATQSRLVRASRTRATLAAHINWLQQPTSAGDIYEKLEAKLTEIGTNKTAVVKMLQSMANHGQIDLVKDGRNVLYYSKGNTKAVALTPSTLAAPLVDAQREEKLSKFIETLTIGDAHVIYLQLHKMFKNR